MPENEPKSPTLPARKTADAGPGRFAPSPYLIRDRTLMVLAIFPGAMASLGSVFVHEYGHWIAGELCGDSPHRIELYASLAPNQPTGATGGWSRCHRMVAILTAHGGVASFPNATERRAWVIAAGPALQLAYSLLLGALAWELNGHRLPWPFDESLQETFGTLFTLLFAPTLVAWLRAVEALLPIKYRDGKSDGWHLWGRLVRWTRAKLDSGRG